MGAKGKPKTGGAIKGQSSHKAKVLATIKEKGQQAPLEYLLEVMNDEEQTVNTRVDAGKSAAPYVHRRQPTEIEQTNMNEMEDKTLEELQTRLDELEKGN